MPSRISWNAVEGPDAGGYSYIRGEYVIWLHMLKCVVNFSIVLYPGEITDIKISATSGESISIYDARRCGTVGQAIQVCEDALSEILQGHDSRPVVNDKYYNATSIQVMMKNLIAAQDALIDKMSNNLAIDVDDPECTDLCKQEAICEIQNLVAKRDIWRKELNELEKAIRRNG